MKKAFARLEHVAADFLTVEVDGRKASVFRPLRPGGGRQRNYYIKGRVRGVVVFRTLGTTDKETALAVAEKYWRAALDGRWKLLDEVKGRNTRKIPDGEMRERIAQILIEAINGRTVNDYEALQAMERTVVLPPELRKFAGSASVIYNVGASAIYVLVKDGKVIYIGQSMQVFYRLYQHQAKREFDTVYILHVAPEDLDAVERLMIATFPETDNKDAGLAPRHYVRKQQPRMINDFPAENTLSGDK